MDHLTRRTSAFSSYDTGNLGANAKVVGRGGLSNTVAITVLSQDDDDAQSDGASEIILWRPEKKVFDGVSEGQQARTKAVAASVAHEAQLESLSRLNRSSTHQSDGVTVQSAHPRERPEGQSSALTVNQRPRGRRRAKGKTAKKNAVKAKAAAEQESQNTSDHTKGVRLDVVYSMLTNYSPSTEPLSTVETMSSCQPSQESESASGSPSVLDLINLSAYMDPTTSACVHYILMFLGSTDEPDNEKKFLKLMDYLEEHGFDKSPKYLTEVKNLFERLLEQQPLIRDKDGWWVSDGRFQKRLKMAKSQREKGKSKEKKERSDEMRGSEKKRVPERAIELDQLETLQQTLDGTHRSGTSTALAESVEDAVSLKSRQEGAASAAHHRILNSCDTSPTEIPQRDQGTQTLPTILPNTLIYEHLPVTLQVLASIRPQEPSNPVELLASKPWSAVEIHLLLDIVAYYPPFKFGWEWIANMYNEWLIENRLKEWATAQSCFGRDLLIREEKRKQVLAAEAEAHGIGIGLKDFVPIVPANTKNDASSIPTVPETAADGHLLTQTAPQGIQPLRSKPVKPSPTPGGSSKVTGYFWPRPDINLPPKQTKLYVDLIRLMRELREVPADQRARVTSELRAVKKELYEEIGGRFKTRTDWECWHRWCVPYVHEAPKQTEQGGCDEAKQPEAGASWSDFRFSKQDPVVTLGNLCGNLDQAETPVQIPYTYPDAPGVQQHFEHFDPRPAMAVYGDIAKMVADEEWRKSQLAKSSTFTPALVQTIPQTIRGSILGFEYDEKLPFPTLDNFPQRREDAPLYTRKKPELAPPQYPNVPEGTLGAKERPGIRAWFQNAAVLKEGIKTETGQGSRDREEEALAALPPHLKILKVSPRPSVTKVKPSHM